MNDSPQSEASLLAFLREKLSNISLREIFRLELEGWLLWIVGGIPGFAGFALRSLMIKILVRKNGGFCWIQPRVTIVHTGRLTIGKMFGVNSGSYINAIGGLTIGDYVLIGSNVTISSGKHPIEGRVPPVFTRATEPLPIVIEDDVWIGAGSVIMPGVTLKRGTVIGANSVVTRDTEEYSIAVGAPAKKIRSRE